VQSFNVLDELVPESAFGPIGEIRLVPDLATFAVLPYASGFARLFCDITMPDGTPAEACARTFLKRMIGRAARAGLSLQAAFENEFTLARREGARHVPIDECLCFSTAGMESAGAVIVDVVDALSAQGVVPELYYVEHGPGQQELPIRFTDALGAADNQLTFRDTVRGVARRHGLVASFAPKPFPDHAGNGSHVHVSLWDLAARRNRFHDANDPLGLSPLARRFIGGVLDHLAGLVALTAPSVNSYRRLQPHAWASAYSAWGPDNREAAVRVPARRRGLEVQSTNLEYKPCDGSANPYLALGAVLAAGLDGIERQADPGAPTLVDPDTLSAAERERRGIRRFPTALGEALDALERDEVLMAALGAPLAREYLAVKRSEVRAFAARDVDFEIAAHFDRY
jgi:glutamine synthetase